MYRCQKLQKEYKNYQGRPEQKKRRAQRNRVRRMMELGKVKKGTVKMHQKTKPYEYKKSNLK